MFKNWNMDKLNYESNNLSIIAIALKRYYLDNIPIKDTINHLIDNGILTPFQLVVKRSSKYDGVAVYNCINNDYIPLDNKVTRVLASVLKTWGKVYRITNFDGYKKYDKYTNSPNNIYIHNGDLKTMNKNVIDRNWYIKLCESYLIENQKHKNSKYTVDKSQMTLFDISDFLII